jgi:hypothetical protein
MNNEMQPYGRYLGQQLFVAILDSVSYPPPITSKITNPDTVRNYEHKAVVFEKDREEARQWIRDCNLNVDDRSLGFGYVWGMLQEMESVRWEIGAFVERMEELWETVDKDPSLGRVITKLIGYAISETYVNRNRATMDKVFELAKAGL